MEYKNDDLKNIAKLLSGLGNVDLPESIKIDETALYECCYDMDWETSILDESNYNLEILIKFLCQLADEEKLVMFIDYYFNKYIENRVNDLTTAGYSIFQLKDKILTSLNALWSIPKQEFGIDNSKFSLKTVILRNMTKWGKVDFARYIALPQICHEFIKYLTL